MPISQNFSSELINFFDNSRSAMQAINREVVLEIGRRLVDYSPIGNPPEWKKPHWPKGYIPGHFINNWQLGIDEIPDGIIQEIDGSGQGSLQRLSKVGRWTVGHEYYFVNNLPYAEVLESGTWSHQVGPLGMVGRIEAEFGQIVQDSVAMVAAAPKLRG